MAIFLTGATGFLGRYLLRELLLSGEEVVPLVRAASVDEARGRITRALDSLGPQDPAWEERLHPCRGALDAPELGLDGRARDEVIDRCDAFLHCGANVRFDLPIETARRVNVEGTRSVLALARRRHALGSLRRFDHVSTAFVAGNRTDLVLESDLDARAGHKNSYERSKFEGESLVRDARADLPVSIFRPSIVVGAEDDGRTTSFNVMYWPIRIYASGLWRICPGNRETPIDIVPVDFVSRAIVALRKLPDSLGLSFHLAAGPDGVQRLGELTDLVTRFFSIKKPVRFVPPEFWMRWVHPVLKYLTFGPPRRVVHAGEFYVPYFCNNPLFDIRNTRELLATVKLPIPRVADYLERLFHFCVETNWGKKVQAPQT
jgi:thioester reductase-like protein